MFRLLLALLSLLPACGRPEVDQGRLERIGREALQLVEQRIGQRVSKEIGIRRAGVEELAGVLSRELEVVFSLQYPDQEDLDAARMAASEQIVGLLLGKYAIDERTILICEENFQRIAALFGEPILLEDEVLAALLVHEGVHAADDLQFGLAAFRDGAADLSGLQARGAVIEGHAQYLAREICSDRGWSEGFETLTRVMGSHPGGASAAEEQMLSIQSASNSFSYADGEDFVRAVARERGGEGVAALFAVPPKDQEEVSHPEWFLHPEDRPVLSYSLAEALQRTRALFDEDEWMVTPQVMNRPQFRASFQLLPEPEVESILDALVENSLLSFRPRAATDSETGRDGGSAGREGWMVSFGVFVFRSAQDGRHFLDLVIEARDVAVEAG